MTTAGIVEHYLPDRATLHGGTRTTIKVKRPWQPKLVLTAREQCPFCQQQVKNPREVHQRFITFDNASTPYSYHRMLIPQ